MAIDFGTSVYTSDLKTRLAKLEGKSTFEVYRVRNEEVLKTLDSTARAEQFISDGDYSPERVKVRELPGDLTTDERLEKNDILAIRDEIIRSAGEKYWNQSKPVYRLVKDSNVVKLSDGNQFALLSTLFDDK